MDHFLTSARSRTQQTGRSPDPSDQTRESDQIRQNRPLFRSARSRTQQTRQIAGSSPSRFPDPSKPSKWTLFAIRAEPDPANRQIAGPSQPNPRIRPKPSDLTNPQTPRRPATQQTTQTPGPIKPNPRIGPNRQNGPFSDPSPTGDPANPADRQAQSSIHPDPTKTVKIDPFCHPRGAGPSKPDSITRSTYQIRIQSESPDLTPVRPPPETTKVSKFPMNRPLRCEQLTGKFEKIWKIRPQRRFFSKKIDFLIIFHKFVSNRPRRSGPRPFYSLKERKDEDPA